MSVQPLLTVVIPVHNAASTVIGLIDQLRSIEEFGVHVIAVDDCSTDGSTDLLTQRAADDPAVDVIVHESNRGAGVARNEGFELVDSAYTLFFDADDVLHTDALVEAVEALESTGADLAILPYRYRRGRSVEQEDMNEHDIEIWSSAARGAQRRTLRLDQAADLLRFSNYPWNKILRTEPYREVGLRFGTTIVHNDILGHWYAMLFARQIVLVDREICTHIVEEAGSNLSNQRNEKRLAVFDALNEAYDLLEAHPALRNRYSHHFWAAALQIAGWARSRISDEWLDEFNVRLQELILRISLIDFARIRLKRSPSLASSLTQRSML